MKYILLAVMSLCWSVASVADGDLADAVAGEHRTEAYRARDSFRHPVETLNFFRVEPEHTVVEIWPGGGWYTEILAPYLKPRGRLYAAHFPSESAVNYFRKLRAGFEDKLAANPQVYGAVNVATFDPSRGVLSVPSGSADRVLTFRNVHNWLRDNSEEQAFELFFEALKPGGMLGVVEHRTDVERDRQWMLENGYMTTDQVVSLATAAGFELVAETEVNANPADVAEYPAGVWSLPPTLRLGDTDRDRYLAIGESDRMTLLFVKPQ